MYRVVTEQRRATPLVVPRHGPEGGYGLDLGAVRAAARDAAVVWLCSPNNPTGLPEPDGTIAQLVADIATDATRDRRRPPIVVLDEAYAEFTGVSLLPLR